MTNPFQKATKKESLLRMAITGPSGGGKTYTALTIGAALIPSAKVALIDTERGSASKYADQFSFDVLELDDFRPAVYVRAIEAAQANGYNVLIIDSLSHAWFAQGGVLSIVDDEAARSKTGNTFMAWRKGTEVQNQLVDAILASKMHVIATMRSKTEYVIETDSRGKQVPRKIGLAPVQRDGVEYEFDVVAEMDITNTMLVQKSRCPALTNAVIERPGADVAATLRAWLSDGDPAPAPIAKKPAAEEPENIVKCPNCGALTESAWIADGRCPNCEDVSTPTGSPMPDSEAQPTTRGQRSTHNPPKASVLDELPPAAAEQVAQELPLGTPRPEDVWVLSKTLYTKTAATMPKGVNWGFQVYEGAKKLGYADEEAVRAVVGVKSLNDWDKTLGELLNTLIDNAPTLAEAA